MFGSEVAFDLIINRCRQSAAFEMRNMNFDLKNLVNFQTNISLWCLTPYVFIEWNIWAWNFSNVLLFIATHSRFIFNFGLSLLKDIKFNVKKSTFIILYSNRAIAWRLNSWISARSVVRELVIAFDISQVNVATQCTELRVDGGGSTQWLHPGICVSSVQQHEICSSTTYSSMDECKHAR